MKPALFDSSIYIASLRNPDYDFMHLRTWRGSFLWLSSVVLEELYAGADLQMRARLERLEHNFEKARRMVVPNPSDWTQTGHVLQRLAEKYGYEQIGRARLTNDTLLAMSVARAGITLFTTHRKDFARIAEFRLFDWQLIGRN